MKESEIMTQKDVKRLVLMSKFELAIMELIEKHSISLTTDEIKKSLNRVNNTFS